MKRSGLLSPTDPPRLERDDRQPDPPGASERVFLCPWDVPHCALMATGKKDGDHEAELEAAIEKIRDETWKPGQSFLEASPRPYQLKSGLMLFRVI
jgi:hypothetical protein